MAEEAPYICVMCFLLKEKEAKIRSSSKTDIGVFSIESLNIFVSGSRADSVINWVKMIFTTYVLV